VIVREEMAPVLAVGGELKNTVCLTKGRLAFLSQHVGDLENLETFGFFQETIAHLTHLLGIEPTTIAYDLHPDYLSTRWALGQAGKELVGVQHHHAHIASCMAENGVDGRVIGIALDGTGYGTDGRIWGGEVLVAGYAAFERAVHLAYAPMPGGAAAIHEPWRMAVGYLAQHFGRDLLDLAIPFVQGLDRNAVEIVLRMVERGVNSPLTSSCGRLFDAVAALAGIRQRVSYEAQAAMELEAALPEDAGDESAYPLVPVAEGDGWRIETRPLFEALTRDLHCGAAASAVSARFHNGLIECFAHGARLVRGRARLDRVCLSGGAFQNAYLLERLQARLRADGFEVFAQAAVPANDGGLSLGQALVAAHRTHGS
ncbi:MAG: Kae1-like domain-containing protein, partial [Planctomycetota bacterium]